MYASSNTSSSNSYEGNITNCRSMKKKGLIRLCDRNNNKKKTTTKFPNSILLTLLALRVISIQFLLVISILCKTEWTWELQTWSHKMYLLDTLSASPHYFCRKWIGATNENSYFDLRDYRVNAKEQTVQSENNVNITEFHPQTQRLKYRLNIKFHGKVLVKTIQSFKW